MSPVLTCPDWKQTENKDKVTHNHGDVGGGDWGAAQVTESQVSFISRQRWEPTRLSLEQPCFTRKRLESAWPRHPGTTPGHLVELLFTFLFMLKGLRTTSQVQTND